MPFGRAGDDGNDDNEDEKDSGGKPEDEDERERKRKRKRTEKKGDAGSRRAKRVRKGLLPTGMQQRTQSHKGRKLVSKYAKHRSPSTDPVSHLPP